MTEQTTDEVKSMVLAWICGLEERMIRAKGNKTEEEKERINTKHPSKAEGVFFLHGAVIRILLYKHERSIILKISLVLMENPWHIFSC